VSAKVILHSAKPLPSVTLGKYFIEIRTHNLSRAHTLLYHYNYYIKCIYITFLFFMYYNKPRVI
jgi:hypothetical protein